jgi:hypothetical protein
MIPVEVQAADTGWVGSPEMDSYMSDMIAAEKAPGISMVIVDGDDVTFHSYGYDNIKDGVAADEYTIYELGSTTKAFTALAVLILDDEGVIDLDADIRTYIPWLELIHEGNPAVITCNQLLSHTAGIPEKYYADAIEGALGGFARDSGQTLAVVDENSVINKLPESKRAGLFEILARDPRPQYHDDKDRVYGMAFGGYEIKFRVEGETLYLLSAENGTIPEKEDLYTQNEAT